MRPIMAAALVLSIVRAAAAQAPVTPADPIAALTARLEASVRRIRALDHSLHPLNSISLTEFRALLAPEEVQKDFAALTRESEDCAKLIREADAVLAVPDLPIRTDSSLPTGISRALTLEDRNDATPDGLQIIVAMDRANVAADQSFLLKLRTSSLAGPAKIARQEKRLARARRSLAASLSRLRQ